MDLIYKSEIISGEISKTGDGYHLKAGDNELDFTISELSPGIYSLISNGKIVKAFVASDDEKIYVNVEGNTYDFEIPKDDAELRSEQAGGEDAYQVLPPMPSKVVKVLVEAGQEVAEGTGLVVLESMKMENLVKSKVAAVVEAVNFKDGDLVDTGQVVIQLKAVEE
ncbi:MAG: hypothetical protein GF307_10055 [candidate division Zixibacteria bacterium]|nr:hypothetical protein [candidate division Zixibacteria bacterium]